VEGEEHDVGRDADTSKHYDALQDWSRKRLNVSDVRWRWSAQDYMTPDHIPYVGRMNDSSETTLVATGFNKWGMTNGTAAAIMLSDIVAGRENPWLDCFDSRRLGGAQSVKAIVQENLSVTRQRFGDRVAGARSGAPSDLSAGEAAVFQREDQRIAAYRDEKGDLHVVRARCTHMGCQVAWNNAERTWDCPCHGSRFSPVGAVLEGPATVALQSEAE
jgi:Rieske Fe-S protein